MADDLHGRSTGSLLAEAPGPLDTAVGQGKKDDAADVARTGFKAMMNGEGDVVSGWHNKLQSAIANVVPASIQQHRRKAAPGSGGTH